MSYFSSILVTLHLVINLLPFLLSYCQTQKTMNIRNIFGELLFKVKKLSQSLGEE